MAHRTDNDVDYKVRPGTIRKHNSYHRRETAGYDAESDEADEEDDEDREEDDEDREEAPQDVVIADAELGDFAPAATPTGEEDAKTEVDDERDEANEEADDEEDDEDDEDNEDDDDDDCDSEASATGFNAEAAYQSDDELFAGFNTPSHSPSSRSSSPQPQPLHDNDRSPSMSPPPSTPPPPPQSPPPEISPEAQEQEEALKRYALEQILIQTFSRNDEKVRKLSAYVIRSVYVFVHMCERVYV